ncbi:recombinase family protein [Patescibacteria group bacterium]|nr:recombinase family protein [Patescibacteria group bacterium]
MKTIKQKIKKSPLLAKIKFEPTFFQVLWRFAFSLSEAQTAKEPGRKVFGEMLDRICAGEASGILAWHPDRLARNSIDGGKIIYLLDTGKLLDLKFPTFWFDSTPQGKFMLSIAFGQSKYYIDNLSENIKRGHRQKLRKGIWPGFAPLGYLNNHRTKEIDLDKEKSPFIKKAFELYATGEYTLKAVRQFLADSGISSYRKRPLSVSCVQRFLKNHFYYGVFRFNNEFYQGSHEPIISKNPALYVLVNSTLIFQKHNLNNSKNTD